MNRRAASLGLVAIVATGALSLGIAAPAQAVDVAPLSSYMLTVPPSVYSAAAGYSTAEQAAWREVARAGVDPKPPTVPVSPSTGWGITAGIQALWLGGMAVVQNLGTIGTVFGVSPDQLSDRYAEQGLTAEEGWQCESLEGDFLGDFFTGVNDWFQGLFGVDCSAMRDGVLEKNPDYEPIGGAPGPVTLPKTVTAGSTFFTLGKPVWASGWGGLAVNTVWVGPGMLYPVSNVSSPAPTYLAVALQETTASGSVPVGGNMFMSFPLSNSYTASASVCGGAPAVSCLSPNKLAAANIAGAGAKLDAGTASYSILSVQLYENYSCNSSIAGAACTTVTGIPPAPFAPVSTGSGPPAAEAGAPQVLLTTVETADGNIYQCRTTSFLETDADIPAPCSPTIPAGQWEVSRTVEMIPASTGSWTVGSDPQRIMTQSESPAEYQDWRTDYPECSNKVCKLDLIKVGYGSCFLLGETCHGWASDPNRASNYTCTYDGQTASMAECEAAYSQVFSQVARDQGQAYPQPNDPATGEPSTGGQTSTVAGPVTAPGSAPLPPNQPRNCFPTGWNAFNPFEWVYQPVRCVLEWAFVPRTQYVDQQIKTMQAKWTGSSLVSLLVVLEDGRDLVLGASGCAGPAVNINIYGASYSGTPLSACASPMAEVAAFSRWFTFAAAWVMAIASIARSIGGVVGFTKLGGD